MYKHNILVTSIGSFSADCVVKSLRDFSKGKIIGCDIFPSYWHHNSSNFDEVLLAPPVKDEEAYLNFINKICLLYDINLIMPLTDPEVDFFNKHKTHYEQSGLIITIAKPEFIEIARNKRKLTEYANCITDLLPIKSWSVRELKAGQFYPLIAKPINGRSSEGVYILNSYNDLKKDYDNDNYIFQEIIDGKVCTIDYIRSSKFNFDFCIPRWEHLRTKNGAGITVEIFHSTILEKIVSKIGKDFDVNGAINIEFISKHNQFYIIDINPRFSAGIGFSKLAGYDFIKSHVNCFTGQNILPPVKYSKFIAEKKMVEVINKELN